MRLRAFALGFVGGSGVSSPPRLLTLLSVLLTCNIRLLRSNDLPAAANSAANANGNATTGATRQFSHNQWTRFSHVDADSLPMVLLSIQENLHDISQRQKQDFTLLRVASDLDVISHRLQNVEEQIARAESYNKMRLEQLVESTMKSEFLIDQLTRRVEKNFQHVVNRFSEMDTFLEKTNEIHEGNANKITRKVVSARDYVTTRWTRLNYSNSNRIIPTAAAANGIRVDSPFASSPQIVVVSQSRPEPAPAPAPAYANISTTTQPTATADDLDFQQRNTTRSMQTRNNVSEGGESKTADLNAINDSSLSPSAFTSDHLLFSDVQKFIRNQSDRIVSAVDEKHTQLEQQLVFLKSSYDECVNLADEVYSYVKLSDKRFDATNYFDNFLESLIEQINSYNLQNVRRLETSVKNNMDAVLNLQRAFADDCRRLQLNEEQMEDKVIAVLQNLLDYIDNRYEFAQRRFLNRNYLIRELAERNSPRAQTEDETEIERDTIQIEADQAQFASIKEEQPRNTADKIQLDDQIWEEMIELPVAHISPSTTNASFNDSKVVPPPVIFSQITGSRLRPPDFSMAAEAELHPYAGNTENAKSAATTTTTTTQRSQFGLGLGLVPVDLHDATYDSATEFEKKQLSDEELVEDFPSSSEHENRFDIAADNSNT